MRAKKITAFILAAALCATSMSGCGINKDATAASMNGQTVTLGVANFYCRYEQATMEDVYKAYLQTSDIWSKDISHLQETIDALKQSAEMLAQEGGLLREELKTKNEEAKLLAQNQIYDELTGDVRNQLKLMKEIIKKQELTPDKRTLLRQLFILGTYIKRRCNLRLMQRDTGIIREEDLLISIQDMISAMKLMDIQAELNWNLKTVFSADFSIYIFDQLEYLLEYERFSINKMAINAEQKTISFSIGGFPGNAPKKDIRQMAPGGYLTEWQNMPDGYRMILREGGD